MNRKMKKIIFVLQTMVRGGVEKELLTIFKECDYTKYDVSLLIMYKTDEEIISEIPLEVKLINLDIDREYYCSGLGALVKNRVKSGKIFEAASIAVKRGLNIEMSQTVISLDELPSPNEEYDVAVCYHIHSPICLKYVAIKINAKKKIGWIHNDFTTTGYRIQKAIKYLHRFDEMVAVSNRVKDEFIQTCPMYSGDVSVAHNILNKDEICELALDIPNNAYFDDKNIKLLSVGRFDKQKGFDLAIEIAKKLKDKEVEFHWYLIGYGEEEIIYNELISKYGLENDFIILGKRSNPYPYIANCDIYVQPSRHEAWGLVVQEARILNKAMVISNFAGSDEQIIDGETGYIVPISNQGAFLHRLEMLIRDSEDRKRLEENLKKVSMSNEDLNIIMSKFM